ncbi:MAG TPA: carboxypeptidase regulatory-like domain-containing protein [Terriglobia bacterium]|nr:carboxypeptidase regulatory-like domain-containing protein [Terriglobia bacterium]
MRRRGAAAVTLIFLVLSAHAFGQTSNATLGGTISDASGALIPGVTITATNTGTGIVTMVLSNEAGAYQFASLQTGTYTVTAELPGFQPQTRNGVALGVSQQVRINFTLQVGAVAQAVEVSVAADTLIATSSSSVGTVLPEYKVRDLPLGGRNVMDLLATTGNTGPTEDNFDGNFAGGRLSAVNVTRDGFNVTDGRYNYGALTSTYTSPDLVEEVRIITAPVDAEFGRGSGQVQMVTRSGTNQFRGSAFWTNRNSALDASRWFNNFNGVQKDYENRNQFGVRFGGPIIKNKTFFFVLVDEQRYAIRQTFVGNVLTPLARQGTFRFFPGVDNQNATGLNPVVDRSGNPVKPPNATGDLQSVSVFGRDPNRPGFDPSGFIQNTLLSRMPTPNDYTVGDGLNTAGIRFTRRVDGYDLAGSNGNDTNRDQFNTRLDHNFSSNHKLSVVYTWERGRNMATQAGITNWPDGYNGVNWKDPRLFTVSFVSTLSSSLVNELRVGRKSEAKLSRPPWFVGRPSGFTAEEEKVETGEQGKEAFKLLPKYNGIPLQVRTTLFESNLVDWAAGQGTNRSADSILYTYGDTLSWSKGVHAFKMGGEYRWGRSISANDSTMTPQARLGAGGPAVQNLDNIAIPGLTGNNQVTARNLLYDLSGSVASIQEGFDIRSPKDTVFRGYGDGIKVRLRDWRSNDFSAFFKDSWKIHPNLTLNLGASYWYFGVPYEAHGLAGTVVGGEKGVCGISCGSLTTLEFVGKNSPNPNKQFFNDDWNNLAPSIGLSWSLPWFGTDKTVIRAGYGWNYPGNNLIGVNTNLENIGNPPGVFEGSAGAGVTYTQAPYLSLANLTLPIPQQFAPLRPVPIDGPRSDSLHAAVSNRVAPYIQNYNFELQRELSRDLTLSVSYVGTKGTKLWNGTPLNAVDIFNNGFLEAFNTTRNGGNAALFDRMLNGLTLNAGANAGLGQGAINGTTLTGSAALRANTNTRTFIANGNVGQLADFLNRNTSVTGKGGGFARNGGLPENFFVINPQFQNVFVHGNLSNSTYHSLQIQATRRLSHGFTSQASYNWSRAIGVDDGDQALNTRDPRNRASDKTLLNYHRTHNFTSNGTYILPLGPGQKFLANAPGFLQRVVERWQFGGIFSWASGPPLSILAPVTTVWQYTAIPPASALGTVAAGYNTPNIVGAFPKNLGKVTKLANGVTYFPGLLQIADPAGAGVTTQQGLNGQFGNKAIADSQGRPLLVNPSPGQVGNLGLRWVEGPGRLGLDVNLIKRVRISESKEFEFRIDTVNVLNHPNFGYNTNRDTQNNPFLLNLNINDQQFGRFTDAQGARRFTISGRLNF